MTEKQEMMMSSDLIKDRDYLNKAFSEMKNEYSTFEAHYKELSEFIEPRRGRFFVDDRNKGDKRYKNIVNSRGTQAVRKAVAGLLAGVASPSRPWFAWTTLDRDLAKHVPSKEWMSLFQRVILLILAKSNFYNMAPQLLKELLVFGTGAMTHVDDFDDVARFYTHTAGSYMIGQNQKLIVNRLAREWQMTVSQIVGEYGFDNCSAQVQNQWNTKKWNNWITVRQMIEPNPRSGERDLGAEFMPYRSVTFEKGNNSGGVDKSRFLRRSGFKGFPAYAPRWSVTGEDIYATDCPGMINLGDIKMLMQQEKDKETAIQKSHKPPLQGPPSLRNQPIANLPGGVTTSAGFGQGQKIESIYSVDPRIREMLFNIERTEARINEGFFVDMFLAITEMEGIQPKNQLQLSQINEERLLMLGPVLEQVHGEWLDKLVRRVAAQVIEADIMPEAPPELQGKELELEFISALAMAQKAVGTSAIERTFGFAGALAEGGFDVSDKLDPYAALDEYSDLVGTPARIVVPTDEARQAAQERQAQQQQAEQMALAAQGANVLKMASEAKIDDSNVLARATGSA